MSMTEVLRMDVDVDWCYRGYVCVCVGKRGCACAVDAQMGNLLENDRVWASAALRDTSDACCGF